MFLERPGTKLVLGSAAGYDTSSRHLSVKLKDTGKLEKLPTTHLVLAAGPWTGSLAKTLLPAAQAKTIGVSGSRAHSLVLKTEERLTAHALFTDMTLEDGDTAEPEIYARPDGTVYM